MFQQDNQEGLTEFSKSLTITNQTTTDGVVKLNLTRTSGLNLTDMSYALVVNGAIQELGDVPSDGEILEAAVMGNETVDVELRLWPKTTYTGSETTFVGEITPEIKYLGAKATTSISSPVGKYVNFNCNGSTCEKWQIVKVEDDRLVLTRQSDYTNATSRTNSERYDTSLTFNDNSLITSVSTDGKNVYLAKTVKIVGGDGTKSCSTSNSSAATCSVSGNTITINGVAGGSATITVSQAAGTNYAAASKTYSVTVIAIICRRATSLHTSGSTTYGQLGTSGTLAVGDAFDCDVNNDGVYDAATERFYYINDYYNTESKAFDNTYAALSYYNVVGSGMLWYGKSAISLNSAISKLPTTTNWPGVSLKTTSRKQLKCSSYSACTSPTAPVNVDYSGKAARLLTMQEFYPSRSKISSTNVLEENGSYFYSSVVYSNVYDGAWLESYSTSDNGWLTSYTADRAYSNTGNYRPIIDVPKSQIQY